MSVIPLISVIMPVYNAELYLKEAIDSILSQTYKDFEFIIINDGSTDSSERIIKKYMDGRIKLISRENKGLVYSLNEGIEASKGTYIARMDADDVSMSTRFEKQLEKMLQCGSDICGCHSFVIDKEGVYINSNIFPLSSNDFTVTLSLGVPFSHGSVMISRNFLRDKQIFYGNSQSEDYDLWVKMFNAGALFSNVDDFLFKYRIVDSSLSHKNKKYNVYVAAKISRKFIIDNKSILVCLLKTEVPKSYFLSNIKSTLIFLLIFRYCRFDLIGSIKKIPLQSIPHGFFRAIFRVFK